MSKRRKQPHQNKINPHELFAYLPQGRNSALTADTICRHFKLSGDTVTENQKRKVRASCEAARKLGYLICSDESGYYKPKNPQEMQRTIAHFSAQVKKMSARLRQMKQQTQKQFNGKLNLV